MAHTLKTVSVGPQYRFATPAPAGARTQRIQAVIDRLNKIAPGLLGDDADDEALEFSDDAIAALEAIASDLEKTPPAEQTPGKPAPKAPPTPPAPADASQRAVPAPINLRDRVLADRARQAKPLRSHEHPGLLERMKKALKYPSGH